jgi:dTMP kinase
LGRGDRRGILVAIEGIDGAGKTTQAQLLADHLKRLGADVVLTKEPTSGRHGQRLRDSARTGRLAPEDELETFIDDRREHVSSLIEPALAAGRVVIVDRYYFSSAAYQGARGLDVSTILSRNEAFAPRPDLLVLLDLPVDDAVARIAQRRDGANLFEKHEDLERTAAVFSSLAAPFLLRVDGTEDPAAIADTILRRVAALLPDR